MDDGQQLGEMTDQYPDDEILEYVCLAPKFYSLMLRNKKTGEIWYETKAKGNFSWFSAYLCFRIHSGLCQCRSPQSRLNERAS